MDEKIINLPCREDIYYTAKETIDRINSKGFKVLFNGNNFDLFDNAKCLISSRYYGIDLDELKEYSLLEHYFTIGEKVKITMDRTKKERQDIYEDYKDEVGVIGIIEEITSGEAHGIGRCLLFDIRSIGKNQIVSSYISGDFVSL